MTRTNLLQCGTPSHEGPVCHAAIELWTYSFPLSPGDAKKLTARELVWNMLAQRCARGLASLYAHANDITHQQAREYQVTWAPQGWTGDIRLVGFEQHLYLRQPGYGPSYVTGKYLIDRLIMDRSRQVGDGFRLLNFFDEMYDVGVIPVSLVRWQMTGIDDEIRSVNETE